MTQERATCLRCGRARAIKYMERAEGFGRAFRCGARASCTTARRRRTHVKDTP